MQFDPKLRRASLSDRMRASLYRVFTDGDHGGNLTVIVDARHASPSTSQLLDLARSIGVPDSGFLLAQTAGEATLRTFSPYEELRQCFQTSLALGRYLSDRAETAVSHLNGERLLVRGSTGNGETFWCRRASPANIKPHKLVAASLPGELAGLRAWVTRGPRPRIVVPSVDDERLETMQLAATNVMALCASTWSHGLVIGGLAHEGRLRVRVFTTSLAGREDVATGGAVLDLAPHFLRTPGAAATFLQGPPGGPFGTLQVRRETDGLHLGATVLSVMNGELVVR